MRYRFYSRWGITGPQFSRIVISYSVTFWLGLLALGGLSLVFSPLLADVPFPGTVTMVGVALLSVSLAYVVAAAVRTRPISVRGFQLPLPSGRLAVLQLLLSSLDWALAGAVLYVLLPRGAAPFPVVLSAFLAAQILGLAAHVPGGVGVFEGVIVLLLKPYMTSVQLAPALVAYRVIYYLAPLSIALIVLAGAEISEQPSPVPPKPAKRCRAPDPRDRARGRSSSRRAFSPRSRSSPAWCCCSQARPQRRRIASRCSIDSFHSA